jgi:hypothetical protein
MQMAKSSLALLFPMLDVIGAVTMISDALPLRRRSQQVDTLKRTVTVRDARLVVHVHFYFTCPLDLNYIYTILYD